MQITKENITAMKLADRVCFYLVKNEDHPRASSATCKIRIIRESKADGVFSHAEGEHVIEGKAYLPGFARKASGHIYCSTGNWQALLLILRAGDEITVSARENGNQYSRAAEIPANKLEDHDYGYSALHQDELCITIRRKDKTIVESMVLQHSFCPDNSARMIE